MKKVSLTIPPALPISWKPKPVSGAKTGSRVLPDGRIQYWIEHDLLRGVTPDMLAWWFQHLEGDIQYQGKTLNRYRVWHPEDHVHVSYERRLPDGSVGPGAAIRIVELASPFPAFPENIRKDTDEIVITRTWKFTSTDMVKTDNSEQP